ncbi:MAG: preprotein translocase subunit YajC [Actinomycetales bacterium]|nr:preprotein translocase subunit YajC [Actinomycetales bacterium]
MNPNDLIIVAMIAVMGVMMFRGNRKRKKQAEELASQLVVGAKVLLHSGIVGRVVSISDEYIVVNSAGSKLEVLRGAVRTASVWEAKEEPAVEVEAAAPVAVKPAVEAKAPAAKKPAAAKTATAAKPVAKAAAKPVAAKKPAAAKPATTRKPAAKQTEN